MATTIPQTKEELELEFRNVSDKLQSLGLSAYESKAYIALVAHGYGTAELIAKTAQIPRTSAYSVLKSLETKGFAIATSGRPVIYKPEPPSKIFDRVRTEGLVLNTLIPPPSGFQGGYESSPVPSMTRGGLFSQRT